MPNGSLQNQILPFYYSNNLPSQTVLDFRHSVSGDLEIFVLASLFSSHVKNLEVHLKFALDGLVSSFDSENGEVLDRMKQAIFTSGDKLADYLISLKEPVDDVDYNVCFVAFSKGVMYVWMDGSLGIRMYRGTESLLVNSKGTPQFFGSATVELGDILEISFVDNLKKPEEKIEDFVLEKSQPNYPALYIDYQQENSKLDFAENTEEQNSYIPISSENQKMEVEVNDDLSPVEFTGNSAYTMPLSHQDDDMTEEKITEDSQLATSVEEMAQKRRAMSFDVDETKHSVNQTVGNLKENFADFSQKIKDSGVLGKAVDYLKLAGTYIWKGLMGFTSIILDFIFGIIYSKNPHQFKRYQNSLKKKNLQYLLILIIFIFVGYIALIRPFISGNSNNNNNNTNNTASDNSEEVRKSLQSQFNQLKSFYTTSNVAQFNSTFSSLNTNIENAKKNGFSDTTFLSDLTSQAQNFNDDLFKITPISKVDEAFVTEDSNAAIVDFSVIGTDVYAVNKTGGQVLKSNSATQKFEIFASDKDLTALSHISCVQTSCYLTDDNLGLVILNLQTKTFSKFSALKDAGKGVKELQAFLVGNTANIYALLPEQSKVVKYTRQGDGITQGAVWNKASGFGAGTVDFTIDGGIFEMNGSGALRRFFGGNPDPTTAFAGLGTSVLALGSDLQIATTPARNTGPGIINRFYVADPSNKRIAVYEKDLDANKQYPFKGSFQYRGKNEISFAGIKQLILSDDEKTLYVLSNNVVSRFSVSAI